MPSKDEKRAELEAQYKAHLEQLEDDDDDDDSDDIIILRGNARRQFLKRLEKMGFTSEEAEEEADEVEEEVVEGEEPPAKTAKTPKAKTPPAKEIPTEDPKPPSRSRYFGGK